MRTEVCGKSIFVEEDGDGPAIICIPGLGSSTNSYLSLVPYLCAHHTMIRVDIEGSGGTPLTGNSVSIESWADDLEALMESRGLESAVLVGHSLGTLIATHFAATRPSRVECLVLLGAVQAQPDDVKTATRKRAEIARAEGMEAIADSVIAATTSESSRSDNPVIPAFIREALYRQDRLGYSAACEALAAARDPDYDAVRAPVLIIVGAEDRMGGPRVGHELTERLSGAQLEIVLGASHWLILEFPGEVANIIGDFLADAELVPPT